VLFYTFLGIEKGKLCREPLSQICKIAAIHTCVFAISSMSRENSNASMLNARERKLPRDSQGKIVTKDSTRQQQRDEKEMRKFIEMLDWFYDKVIRNLLTSGLDSGSSWLDGVNGILMQQEPNLLKQDYWNRRAIASFANTLITVVEPVPMPLLSSMLLLQL
jgi:hypothetical protein